MTVLQDVYLRTSVVLEEEEIASLQETGVLPIEVLRRGVSVQAEGGHYIPADASWSGDDVNIALEEGFSFTAFTDEEQDDEPQLDESEPELDDDSSGEDD